MFNLDNKNDDPMMAKEKHTGKKDTEESQTQELKKVLYMDVGLTYIYGDICIPIADSCWGLTENKKIL